MHLEHLVYVSRATFSAVFVMSVSDILEQSARHNSSNNITGSLAFTETYFVQILEGSDLKGRGPLDSVGSHAVWSGGRERWLVLGCSIWHDR